MVRTALFLLLLNTSGCCGFGFKSCFMFYPGTGNMWCSNQNIANLTDVLSKIPDNTTKLNMSKNKINVIPPGSWSHLSGLKYLDMSQNKLAYLKGGAFRGLGVLKLLNLTRNNISHINSSSFDGLISAVETLVDLLLFSSLDLFSNSIRMINLSCFPALQHITLSFNPKLELQSDVFASNPGLKKSALRGKESPLTICGLLKGMEQLDRVEVDLKRSRLPETNSSLMDCDTPRLRTLQLNRNAPDIQRDTFLGLNHLTSLGVDRCSVRDVDPNWFVPLKKLTRLSLIKNDISWLRKNVFSKLNKLEELYLQFNMLKYIINKPFSKLRRLIKLNLSSNIIIFIKSHTFEDLINLRSLSLNGNRIKMLSTDILSGLTNLRKMVLYNNRLHFKHNEAPFINLTSLEFLDMRYQGPGRQCIGVIGPHFFKEQTSMFSPLTCCLQITHWSISKFGQTTFTLWTKNMLDALPRLLVLDISDNPISCNCDNAWSRTGPSTTLKQGCPSCTTFGVTRKGPTVRYLLLVLRAKLRGRRSAKFQYDAFISYSSKDEGWVMKQLVPNLERPAAGAPPLRLCLHHRDFRPGAAVLENIEAAIYGSRHTICVVTRNFLQSEWCSVEFQLASLRLLYDGSDVLLLVFLEEIPERCLSPYTRLCKIVRKKTYLLWPEEPQEQDTFWVRLVDALKDKEEEEGEGGGEHDMARLIG
ncbi:hypothetical protein KUCAC02_027381 [Chaenocephalus aceratus]|uniref:Uncharacterized protein n=1 Tax=Chaenocephalus aceratus TaxID=36190 RepID=A0ACB9W3L7_CHAAC|nr:hypothetical protein KUCAC02_027381 [Chaenocephalus aceratus]